jgi:hypothetical protein
MRGIDVRAVGVATPAVLTAELAEGCSDYVTSVVLMVGRAPTRRGLWCSNLRLGCAAGSRSHQALQRSSRRRQQLGAGPPLTNA